MAKFFTTVSRTSESMQSKEKDFHFNFPTEKLMLLNNFNYYNLFPQKEYLASHH